MDTIDLKSDDPNKVCEESNSLSQLLDVLNNKETSFIEPKVRNGPSVLLKHSVSGETLNDLQKSKSAPYLADCKSNAPKLRPNVFSNQNYLTGSPNLFKHPVPSLRLTSTPNLLNNNSKLLTISSSKMKNHPVINQECSSLNSNFPLAIAVKNVSFDYKNNIVSSTNILRNVNLNCSIGSIYGLLGPSGCGKTTLIKLILGKYKPIVGEVRAFGYDVLSKYSGVIGSGVGYMPQELALIFDFTIEEQLTYFGRLYYMPQEKIDREVRQLIRILDLPEKTRLIHHLSGGQKHRVSFACALIHKPRLLILDEPTVGLDPVLRENCWLQLLSLAKNYKTTILITTHYIEEAKRADMIGFLRKGQMLVEQTPKFLMKKYETPSLESIFFKLCIEQIQSKNKEKSQNHIDVDFNNSVNEMIENSNQKNLDPQTPSTSSTSSSPNLNELKLNNDYKNEYNSAESTSSVNTNDDLFKIPWIDRNNRSGLSKWFIQFYALIVKYFILTKRQPETILAQYVLPLVAISVFCVCVGSTPTGIKLGVIIEEDCGYPYDLNQNFTQPFPENSVREFIKKLESLFGVRNPEDIDENVSRIRMKRDVEVTTFNLDMFKESEEMTAVYPSKFNLMNNLNFNENKHGLLKDHEPKTLNDLIASNDENSSIDKLLSHKPETVTSTVTAETSPPSITNLNNHRLTTNLSTESSTPSTTSQSPPLTTEKLASTSSTTESSPAAENEKDNEEESSPILMPVHSNEANSDEHHNDFNNIELSNGTSNDSTNDTSVESNDESSKEKLPNEEEEDEEMMDEEMKGHAVNSQFENACFSQDLVREMNSFIFTKIPYDSHEKAIEDVRSGKIWGVIRIKKGFSRALISKILFQDYGDTNISNSLVEVNADLTNRALTITLEVALSRLYPEFIKGVIKKANKINQRSNEVNHTNYKIYNLNAGRLPIVLGSHVFKAKFTLSDYFGIREFAAPGLLIILTYSISYALTVFSLVTEISDKMFDRHQCIGLTSNQLIFSHLLTRFTFSSTGIILVILMSMYFFDISNHGSFLNAVCLLLLQSYCAMTHGMLISVLCPSLFICASISNGYLFFVFIISGVLWSSETLPPLMKQIGYLMPSTIPCESLRTIMTRGQGFESNFVIYGYIVTIIWIFIHYFLTIIVFNYRKNTK